MVAALGYRWVRMSTQPQVPRVCSLTWPKVCVALTRILELSKGKAAAVLILPKGPLTAEVGVGGSILKLWRRRRQKGSYRCWVPE